MAELPKDKPLVCSAFYLDMCEARENRGDVQPEGVESKKHIMKRGS